MREEGSLRAIIHIKTMKRVTVDQVCHCVKNELKRDVAGVHFNTLAKKYELKIPVSRAAVRRWMIRSGCT